MKIIIKFLAALIVIWTPLYSGWFNTPSIVGSGNVIEKQLFSDSIEKIEMDKLGFLKVVAGEEMVLKVIADDNIHEHLIQKFDNGVLYLGIQSGVTIENPSSVQYVLVVPPTWIRSMSLSGIAEAEIDSIVTSEFCLQVCGYAEVDIHSLECDTFNCKTSSDVTVCGKAKRQNIVANGFAVYNGKAFKTEETNLNLTNANAKVFASEKLSVDFSKCGSANVICYGSPKEKKISNRSVGESTIWYR